MLNQENTKKQGDVGLGIAIGYFSAKGFTVSIPLTDSQDYDLIVDIDNELKRVQIKTTSYKRNRDYLVSLTTKGGNRSGAGKIKELNKEIVDYLFILDGDKKMYLIPTDVITAKSSITLTDVWDEYLVRF